MLTRIVQPSPALQSFLGSLRAVCVVRNPLPFQGREGVAKTTYPRHPRISLCF